MTKRLRVGVIFGGRSGEHEVSLMSAASIISALAPEKYEVVPIGITREGRWMLPRDAQAALETGLGEGRHVAMLADPKEPALVELQNGSHASARDVVYGDNATGLGALDVVFPVLHGPYGEDGTIQGLLELADIPYVGSGVLGSAAGMDKGIMKNLFVAEGLQTPDFLIVSRAEWEKDPVGTVKLLDDRLGYPVFVKPANLGSSVGITKAHDREGLRRGLAMAAEYDRRIIVENSIEDAREIECSVLGNDVPQVSVPGEIVPANEFYDYDAKYFNEASQLIIPADLPEEVTATIRDYSLRAFKAIDCAGMARVDFLVTRDKNDVYINELNTIPGFTRISMYPKLWEASGTPYPLLVDRLIELALDRHRDRQRARTTY